MDKKLKALKVRAKIEQARETNKTMLNRAHELIEKASLDQTIAQIDVLHLFLIYNVLEALANCAKDEGRVIADDKRLLTNLASTLGCFYMLDRIMKKLDDLIGEKYDLDEMKGDNNSAD